MRKFLPLVAFVLLAGCGDRVPESKAAKEAGNAPKQRDRNVKNHARMGINVDDRRNAEFSDDEIAVILRQSGMGSFLTDSRAQSHHG